MFIFAGGWVNTISWCAGKGKRKGKKKRVGPNGWMDNGLSARVIMALNLPRSQWPECIPSSSQHKDWILGNLNNINPKLQLSAAHRPQLWALTSPFPHLQTWQTPQGWSRKDKQEAQTEGTIIAFNPHQTPLIPLVFSISSLPLLKKLMSHKDKADNELFIGRIMGWGCNLLVLLETNISILEHHKTLGFNTTFCVVRDGFMNRLRSWTLSESS